MNSFHIYKANISVVLVKQVQDKRQLFGTAQSSDISETKNLFSVISGHF